MRSGQLPLRLDRNELFTSLNRALPSLYSGFQTCGPAMSHRSSKNYPHYRKIGLIQLQTSQPVANLCPQETKK